MSVYLADLAGTNQADLHGAFHAGVRFMSRSMVSEVWANTVSP